jgi:hypothetical protein
MKYNDFDRGYMELNAAMWKQAVDDEIKLQKQRLFDELWNLYSYITIVNVFDKEFVDNITEEAFNNGTIDKAIRFKIYRESMRWPNNIKNERDAEYEKVYIKVKNELINKIREKEAV